MEAYVRLRREIVETRGGSRSAHRLAEATDEAVSALAEGASSRLGRVWAAIALGGYGSGRLLPRSDIDLLLLTEASGPVVKETAKDLLYPLWDAGLEVGHQVRTRRQHIRACREDLQTLTASLTGRVVAGDRAYGEAVLRTVARDAYRRRHALTSELAARPRPGSQYLLEPDLKEGVGGQRDLDEMTWTAAILLADVGRGLHGVERLGLLAAGYRARLDRAAEDLTAARWELQRTGTGSRMTLEAAERLGPASEAVQEAMCEIAERLACVREAVAGTEGMDADPRRALDLEGLLAALSSGDSSVVERAAWRGELEHLVPGIRMLMPLRRPGLSHTLTVGAHCIRTAACISSLGDSDISLARSREEAGEDLPLYAAALMHDAGKMEPGAGHPARSERSARRAGEAWGLAADDVSLAGSLASMHLLLPEAALRTDPKDPEAVSAIARKIGDARTLASLHLLSAADATATGPGAWSPWHSALLGELVSAIRSALLGSSGASPEAVLAAALAELKEGPAADWLRCAPENVLAGRAPTDVAADARLVGSLLQAGGDAPPVFRVAPGQAEGVWRLVVAAHDRPGLLASLAGIVALSGLDVLAASVTGWGGIVLDSFTVRSATLAPITHEVWVKAERSCVAAWRGRLALDTRLRERRSHYRSSISGRLAPVVRVETPDEGHTVVEVTAEDRVGLLYDLACAFHAAGLQVLSMNALVQDGIARDTFRMTSADGSHREPGVVGHLSMSIRERLAQ